MLGVVQPGLTKFIVNFSGFEGLDGLHRLLSLQPEGDDERDRLDCGFRGNLDMEKDFNRLDSLIPVVLK